ncbi:MAG: DNA polymerase IV, partial [Candidatus Thorarchaeota archaeon]|nr:DNA polymerase IV [Candidatus Thorarchaeota archaeon]NIW15724.1 DNA polymerase IV [Candidatus Thorarchaeota archaeon]
MGIETIGDLANYDPAVLRERFGVSGTQLHLMAHGIDRSEVQETYEVKSISRELTFQEDTADSELILGIIDELSAEVHRDVLEQALFFKTVTVKIRFGDFETHTHGKTLSFPTDRLQDLKKLARELTQEYLGLDRKIRLVGVRVSNFSSA